MLKVFEFISEACGWIKIVLSPLLIGVICGLAIYGYFRNTLGLISGILVSFGGLIIGIVWATNVWKRMGTNNFLSKIYRTPELDKEEEAEGLKK